MNFFNDKRTFFFMLLMIAGSSIYLLNIESKIAKVATIDRKIISKLKKDSPQIEQKTQKSSSSTKEDYITESPDTIPLSIQESTRFLPKDTEVKVTFSGETKMQTPKGKTYNYKIYNVELSSNEFGESSYKAMIDEHGKIVSTFDRPVVENIHRDLHKMTSDGHITVD